MDRLNLKSNISESEHVEIQKKMTIKNALGKRKIFTIILVAIYLNWMLKNRDIALEGTEIIIFIIFVAGLFAVLFAMDIFFAVRRAKLDYIEKKKIGYNFEYLVTRNGISILNKGGVIFKHWTEIAYYVESENMYALVTRGNTLMLINKSAFKDYDEMHFFMSCLEQRKKPRVEETEEYIIEDIDK